MTRIDLVFPNALRVRDGIADHTRHLALELGARHDVRVLGRGLGTYPAPLKYVDAWSGQPVTQIDGLCRTIADDPPDLVVLQFEQFSYGERGFNPRFPTLPRKLRKLLPQVRIVAFMHETYATPTRLGTALMWSFQSLQARTLVRNSDAVLHSCSEGLLRLGGMNPNSRIAPVPSNIPRIESSTEDARERMGIGEEALLVGIFGQLSQSRVEQLRPMLTAIATERSYSLAYVGKDVDLARTLAPIAPQKYYEFQGRGPAEVSHILTSLDMALAPFPDGLSARRGSFMALLEHRVPTVTNRGSGTDEFLVRIAERGAFSLVAGGAEPLRAAATALARDEPLRRLTRAQIDDARSALPSWRSTAATVERELPA